MSQDKWPINVGILGIEIYTPNLYVDQTELEAFDGVSAGKYTIGLGQTRMGFCNDQEDINSMCLTVLTKLMQTYNIDPTDVGRLDVGTETLLDKSKSVKSVLMQVFEKSNTEIDGLDTTNACFGGTAALFNAINWIESSSWDGRHAIVITGDIAVYAKGNARPTGGAGAVALLIGPGAPLVIERGLRSTFMKHVYDFYKPDMNSEYPVVDGKLSIQCYFNALDVCYQSFCEKAEKANFSDKGKNYFSLDSLDFVLFHTPYCRLVEKSLARLMLNDIVRIPNFPGPADLMEFRNQKLKDTYFNKELEKLLLDNSKQNYSKKTEKSLYVAKNVGNMYTASLYGALVSLIINYDLSSLFGVRVGMFSYGSGLASSMFSIRISDSKSPLYSLQVLKKNLMPFHNSLNDRHRASPEEFSKMLIEREQIIHKAPYTPVGDRSTLRPGTWYLETVDGLHRRQYKQVQCGMANGTLSS